MLQLSPTNRISSPKFNSETILDSYSSSPLLVPKSTLIPVDAATALSRFQSLCSATSLISSLKWLSVFLHNSGSHQPECLLKALLRFQLSNTYATKTRGMCYESAEALLVTPNDKLPSNPSYNLEQTIKSRP